MSLILFEKINHVAKISLHRPDKMNSFNRAMALELQAKLDDCNNDKTIRCVLLTGSGNVFSAGQDLTEAIEDNGIELQTILKEHYHPIILKIRNLQKPVVAAVNGVAAGAGANIALACDIVIATESASFIQAFSKIGLIPDSGGTFILPRLIGWQKAMAYCMLGVKINAKEAERVGMIYKYFADEEFEQQTMQLTETLANMPTQGLWLTKKLFNESVNNNLETQLLREEDEQIKAGKTYDYNEGVSAFLEKRKPVFKGE